MAYLDENGLLYVWNKIKTYVTGVLPTKVSDLTNDAGYTSNIGTITKVKTTAGSHTAVDISSGAVNMNVPTKTSHLTNDSGFITSSSVPSASTTTPKMDGTAAVGTETKWAKGDHVHPTDTSRVPTTRKVNGIALSGDITVGTDDIPTSGVTGKPGMETLTDDLTEISDKIDEKVDAVSGKGLSTNDYTTAEKNKLAGIATGAEVNQYAFSYIAVGSETISADGKTDTLTLTAGSNVSLTPDVALDKVTISATNTTYPAGSSALIEEGTNVTNRVWSSDILHNFVSTAVANAQTGSAKYKGSLTAYSGITVPYSVGDYWVVKTAGTYAGQTCEVGDMIFCNTARASGGTKTDTDFDIIQSNITAIPNSQIDTICV